MRITLTVVVEDTNLEIRNLVMRWIANWVNKLMNIAGVISAWYEVVGE